METTERPQFIVERSKFNWVWDCYEGYFVDGKADLLKILEDEDDYVFAWVYWESDYDLIKFLFDNDLFNWERDGWAIPKFRPQYFDPNKFDFEKHSWSFVDCPDLLIAYPDKFDWENWGFYIEDYLPHLLHLKPKNT